MYSSNPITHHLFRNSPPPLLTVSRSSPPPAPSAPLPHPPPPPPPLPLPLHPPAPPRRLLPLLPAPFHIPSAFPFPTKGGRTRHGSRLILCKMQQPNRNLSMTRRIAPLKLASHLSGADTRCSVAFTLPCVARCRAVSRERDFRTSRAGWAERGARKHRYNEMALAVPRAPAHQRR